MSTVTSRVSGCLLILLGAWGGLVPFIGPYFGYYYGPNKTWDYTSNWLWLSMNWLNVSCAGKTGSATAKW